MMSLCDVLTDLTSLGFQEEQGWYSPDFQGIVGLLSFHDGRDQQEWRQLTLPIIGDHYEVALARAWEGKPQSVQGGGASVSLASLLFLPETFRTYPFDYWLRQQTAQSERTSERLLNEWPSRRYGTRQMFRY